jgi:hypothetical protein
MSNLFDMTFTFNSNINQNESSNIKVFLDKTGNIIDNNKVEYGIYNKAINIKITKLFFIKKYKLGIGDIIDFFTKTFYIKNLIVYLTNGNCGCEERRIKFNKYYIPWYTFKIREMYFQDEDNLNTLKNIKKMNIKLNEYKERKTIKRPPPIKHNIQENITTQQEIKNQKPIDPIKVKKSCGCSQRNS